MTALRSIYDPFGWDVPFLLKGRKVIQTLCKQNLKWDDSIDDGKAQEWLKWSNNLIMLHDQSLPCFTNCTLHHFSDIFYSGCGQCSYIRSVNDRA